MKDVAILMQSRTGSSLVAAIFRAHGWHTGGEGVHVSNRLEKPTYTYVSYENQAIRNHLVQTYGSPRQDPVAPTHDDVLATIVESLPSPWAFKGDVFYADVFTETFPDIGLIYVQRDVEDAIDSSMDRRTFPIWRGGVPWQRPELEAELREFLVRKYDLMDRLREWHGGALVDTTEVMAGELGTIRDAIAWAGGTWDEDVAVGAFDAPPEAVS